MYLSKSSPIKFAAVLYIIFFLASCGEEGKKETSTENTARKEAVVQNSSPSLNSFDHYLTAEDIEKVSGIKGVKLIPKNPSIGAGGDLNFAAGNDNLIVMVQVVNQNNYTGYKKYFFRSDINGLGEEAMKGATLPNNPENLVAFRKGARCIALTVFVNKEDFKKNMLTIEQAAELAKIIDSRI